MAIAETGKTRHPRKGVPPHAHYRFTGKERDEETGLYYYGARYLNPQTSLWLSVDPAMGEYVPGAPINDEVKKQNQNLPGMGGVYNLVNLHVYHYAGNNPVKYIDPDGRESGYVRRAHAIAGRGHAGVFAVKDGKYIFTEVTKIKDIDVTSESKILTRPENRNTGAFPISVFNKDDIAVVQYTFDNYKEMMAFFKKNEFTDYIEFMTSTVQDVAIVDAATQLGENFTNYLIPGNHCGIFAERALDAGGKGIKTSAKTRGLKTAYVTINMLFPSIGRGVWLWLGIKLQSPNDIGDQLMRKNHGRIIAIE